MTKVVMDRGNPQFRRVSFELLKSPCWYRFVVDLDKRLFLKIDPYNRYSVDEGKVRCLNSEERSRLVCVPVTIDEIVATSNKA